MTDSNQRLLLGRITGVRGLKGEVVVHSFTADPGDIAAYGPLTDATGRTRVALKVVRVTDKGVVALVDGVRDRTAAEKLKGTELWIDRALLPPAGEGEYYHSDLIGLAAVTPDGRPLGRVVSVNNFGAGDLLELKLEGQGQTEFVPFTDAVVPRVDVAAGQIIVAMPDVAASDDDDEDDELTDGEDRDEAK